MRLTGLVAVIAGRGHRLSGGISTGRISRHEASTITVGVLADVENVISISVCPDIEVFDRDVGTRDGLRAVDLDRTSLGAILSGSCPRAEGNVRVIDTITVNSVHG